MVLSSATEVALCGGEGDCADLLQRDLADQLDAIHRPERRDTQMPREQQPHVVARVGDRADRPEIDVSGGQHAVEVGGNAGEQLHPGTVGPVEMPVVGEHAASARTRSTAGSS